MTELERFAKLSPVISEMEAVLKRHDLVGSFSVVDQGAVLGGMRPEASWTVFKILGSGIETRIGLEPGDLGEPLYRKRVKDGILSLLRLREGMQQLIASVDKIVFELAQTAGIDAGPLGLTAAGASEPPSRAQNGGLIILPPGATRDGAPGAEP